MTTNDPTPSHEKITQGLSDQAKLLWGEVRAEELTPSLENTASQLLRLADNLPERDLEPGFYP